MHQARRRDRRPAQRTGAGAEARAAQHRVPASVVEVEGADVVIVGYFSGKQRDWAALMDAAARTLEERGARVVGRIVQRRGVSAGGAKKMALPYSSRTLLSYGKVREAAALRERTNADAAVFVGDLTQRQCWVLTGLLGCAVLTLAEALASETSA